VLPSHTERLAITAWYFDYTEREDATGASLDASSDAAEAAAIAREIGRFEARFGAAQDVAGT